MNNSSPRTSDQANTRKSTPPETIGWLEQTRSGEGGYCGGEGPNLMRNRQHIMWREHNSEMTLVTSGRKGNSNGGANMEGLMGGSLDGNWREWWWQQRKNQRRRAEACTSRTRETNWNFWSTSESKTPIAPCEDKNFAAPLKPKPCVQLVRIIVLGGLGDKQT